MKLLFHQFWKTALFCAVISWGMLVASSVTAADSITITLNAFTLKSGYTVYNPSRTFELGIRPGSIVRTKRIRAHVRKAKPGRYSTTNQTVLSDIHIYKVSSRQKFKMKKKLWVKLSYPAVYKDTDKVIKYWDATANTWKSLKTKDNPEQLAATAALRHRYAVLGVFESKAQTSGAKIEGIASWYDGSGAASNDFPMGTTIRVTNANTGAQVDSTVTSTGPFVPGRVVDLTREDFSAIANLSSGVVQVIVQQVE